MSVFVLGSSCDGMNFVLFTTCAGVDSVQQLQVHNTISLMTGLSFISFTCVYSYGRSQAHDLPIFTGQGFTAKSSLTAKGSQQNLRPHLSDIVSINCSTTKHEKGSNTIAMTNKRCMQCRELKSTHHAHTRMLHSKRVGTTTCVVYITILMLESCTLNLCINESCC